MKNRMHNRSGFSEGCGWVDLGDTPVLTQEEERSLAIRVDQGDEEARDHMILANLPLVAFHAKGFQGRGVPYADLIAEGNLGLIKAVETFDHTLGVRFSTHAKHWIKQSLALGINAHTRPIRIPAYMVVLLGQWSRASAVLAEQLGRDPMSEEIGEALGLSETKTADVVAALRLHEKRSYQDEFENESSMLDCLPDERCSLPDANIVEEEDWERVADRLDRLGPRESAIIRMRFGLEDDEPMTLHEVGKRFNLTRERVRQLERGALAELAETCAY